MKSIVLDTETTGLPPDYKAPANDASHLPRLVQLGLQPYEDEPLICRQTSPITSPAIS